MPPHDEPVIKQPQPRTAPENPLPAKPTTPQDSCITPNEDQSKIKISPRDIIVAYSSERQRVTLEAKAETRMAAGINPDLKGAKLDFFSGTRYLGSNITNENGIASLSIEIPAKPGMIYCYQVSHKDLHKMSGRVYFFAPTMPVFISDVDEVISDLPEFKVPITPIVNSPAMPNSADVLSSLSQRYAIIYLTARDDALLNKTRSWLRYRNFPSGPLIAWNWASHNKFGSSTKAQGIFKQNYLKSLKKSLPNLVAGIGNRIHDALAYKDAGIKPIIINPQTQKSSFPPETVFVRSWDEVPELLPHSIQSKNR
jgi:hypothetical protein